MTGRKKLASLNTPEPRPAMILRLLNEALAGKTCDVSVVAAIEFRREAYGLSRTEFAGVLGLTSPHYSEIVNGKRRLPLTATKRAYAIGVPADALLQMVEHD